MMLTELTTVPPSALPVATFKTHLRLGSGFADDGVQDEGLENYLRAAMAAIEARTGKILIEREFCWTVTAWRDDVRQPLPLAPVTRILRLVIVSRTGEETQVSPARYVLERDDQRPAVVSTGSGLPSIPTGGTLRVEMLAGYAAAWTGIPDDLQQAVMMLAAHFYEYRHETAINGAMMPFGVSALIERYRTVRLFMGGGR